MRKLILIGFIVFGALVGLLSASKEDWPTRVVMMVVGALVGTAIGGGLTRMGSRNLPKEPTWSSHPHGEGTPEDELVRNYWRDRGYSPFMKPPDVAPDRHMFDTDRLG